jgi:BMFP domain-containing protein YqiC
MAIAQNKRKLEELERRVERLEATVGIFPPDTGQEEADE